MEELVSGLRKNVLPDCFELRSEKLPVSINELPCENLEDWELFPGITSPVFIQRYQSGFLASLALSLWFMEFDEDNWFSFNEIHRHIEKVFLARKRQNERIELLLLKGSCSPGMMDLPVLIDHREKAVWVLRGKLKD